MSVAPTEIISEDPTRISRAPSDVLRLGVGVVLLLGVTIIGALFDNEIVEFTADLLRGLDRFPAWSVGTAAVLAQLAGIAVLLLVVVVVVRCRSVLLVGGLVGAAVGAALLASLLTRVVDAEAPRITDLEPLAAAGRSGRATAIGLAALTGVVSATAPWASRRWRQLGWAGVILLAAVLFATAPVALSTGIALLCGWVAGTAAVVLTGSPSHRPTGAAISAGLAAVGVPLARLEQVSLDARGSTPYFGTATDGTSLFVKALGADERSADLMFRAYRRLQRHDLGDERAFSTLRRAVEHEALVALSARGVGVRTPRLVAFATAEPNGFVLAYEAIAGRSLDRVAPDDMSDALLDGVWAQLAILRHHRIAHRDLRLANVFVADDGLLWMIDFGFSELAASDLLLANDLAEALASSSIVVGPRRATAAAVRALGPEAVATALDRLQLPMLSGATRTALQSEPGALDALRADVQVQTRTSLDGVRA